MPGRGRRPDAWAVSYPGEDFGEGNSSTAVDDRPNNVYSSPSPSVASTSTAQTLGKRKQYYGAESEAVRPQRQLPPYQQYRTLSKRQERRENAELVIPGESPDDEDGDDQKPVRVLDDFSIFDPKHGYEMVLLDALEHHDGVDCQFEAAGMVTAYYDNDEDIGQDDDDEQELQPVYLRLSSILRFTINYHIDTDPVYIETEFAWYLLRSPSETYRAHWQYFCMPHRIAQIVISRALTNSKETYASFLAVFESKTLMTRTFVECDIRKNITQLHEILLILDEPEYSKIRRVPFVDHILQNAPSRLTNAPPAKRRRAMLRAPFKVTVGRDIDLAVLRPENQGPTRVTPRIAKLAEGYFRDEIMVVGSAPPAVDKAALAAKRKKMHRRLWALIEKSQRPKKIDYDKANRVSLEHQYYSAVKVDGKTYKIGDVVLVPNVEVDMPTRFSDLPEDSQIHDFFWFAQIHYIVIESQVAHIQWFNHASQTYIAELAHPQELFLANQCGPIKLDTITDKVNVHIYPDAPPSGSADDYYFCKCMHNLTIGEFKSIDREKLDMFSLQPIPDNCPSCQLTEEDDHAKIPKELRNEKGARHGVMFGGTAYHHADFVLYSAVKGPAHIGYITGIKIKNKEATVTIQKVGRVMDLPLPVGTLRDERHLFLTEEKATIAVEDLNKVIYVPCIASIPDLEEWLDLSSDHFYLTFKFPRLQGQNWHAGERVDCKAFNICTYCLKECMSKRKLMHKFINYQRQKPLRTLDLFGGVGAFSQGLAKGSSSLKITAAIEISPSAAKTFGRNSRDTTVFNQCANEMLRYIVKSQEGHRVEVPRQIYDDTTVVPPPPHVGEVDVITAGFPCQSHSALNMFKNAQDAKSNLILTTLSYIDHYSPRFGYFENVPGFLRYNLNSQQVDAHTTRGGVPSGGLKLFVRALLDMKYQVRIGQLQAGHFGTPQRRVRFFIIAAKHGEVLPDFPHPTHDFPENKSLQIKVSTINGASFTLEPVRSANGIAHHPVVSIADAIFDLPRFDWKHPKSSACLSGRNGISIKSFDCHSKDKGTYCGYQGDSVAYFLPPQTRYQLLARSSPTRDIQHYTRRFISKKVERVLSIPLRANADYTSLPAGLHEWQLVDPSSAKGRKKYNPGAYGRADKDGVFQTTVTNMEPTAKQSRVLHPRDHRMFTVRELARSQGFPDSFVFESLRDHVVTMHRQIGNAVPLPVGHALGRELREALFKKWVNQRQNAVLIESDSED